MEDLHKLCSTSHILAKGTRSHSLRRLHHSMAISHPSHSLALHASWLFYLAWSENHPQRRDISVIKINIPSIRFITFIVIYTENFLHLEIYIHWPSFVGRGFFSWVSVCFSFFVSKFSIPANRFCFSFSCSIAENKVTILQLHIWWVHLVSCFKYYSGL